MICYTSILSSKHCGINLAYEKNFFEAKKDPQALYLFFYENNDAVVLGKSLELEKEVFAHKGPEVFRRISGGGSVFHSRGSLNYALFLSLEAFPQFMNISLSYDRILRAVSSCWNGRVIQQGLSDLALKNRGSYRKISGNAQCRKKGWIMHHGTLVYSKRALSRIPYYLKPPPKEPDYRRGRTHGDFMARVLPCYSRAKLIHTVREGVSREFGAELHSLPPTYFNDLKWRIPFQAERRSKSGRL